MDFRNIQFRNRYRWPQDLRYSGIENLSVLRDYRLKCSNTYKRIKLSNLFKNLLSTHLWSWIPSEYCARARHLLSKRSPKHTTINLLLNLYFISIWDFFLVCDNKGGSWPPLTNDCTWMVTYVCDGTNCHIWKTWINSERTANKLIFFFRHFHTRTYYTYAICINTFRPDIVFSCYAFAPTQSQPYNRFDLLRYCMRGWKILAHTFNSVQ